MAKRVFIAARDLFFRSKLAAVVQAAGGAVVPGEGDCDVAVIELGVGNAEARIRAWVARGVAVLAFGSHVEPGDLRAARAAGAVAVANSQARERLAALLRD